MTGFGTASRSDMWPASGEAIPNAANRIPPVALRMSRRSVTVSSLGPKSIDAYVRPM